MEKRVQDYSKEILKIIRSNTSPAVMGERLQDYHENDLADVMPKLTVQERCKLYRILPSPDGVSLPGDVSASVSF